MPTIKEEMTALDTRDFSWYRDLSEKERKELSMWVLMRWSSAVSSNIKDIEDHYLTFINDLVNTHFNSVREHEELQWRLMQVAGIGSTQRHEWIAPGRKGTTTGKKLKEIYLQIMPWVNDTELELLIESTEHTEFLKEHGFSDSEIKKILKDLK